MVLFTSVLTVLFVCILYKKNLFFLVCLYYVFMNTLYNISTYIKQHEQKVSNPFILSLNYINNIISYSKLQIYNTNIYLAKKYRWWDEINLRYNKMNNYFIEFIHLNKELLLDQIRNTYINLLYQLTKHDNNIDKELFDLNNEYRNKREKNQLNNILVKVDNMMLECLDVIKVNKDNLDKEEIKLIENKIKSSMNVNQETIDYLYDSDQE